VLLITCPLILVLGMSPKWDLDVILSALRARHPVRTSLGAPDEVSESLLADRTIGRPRKKGSYLKSEIEVERFQMQQIAVGVGGLNPRFI
jgi:hypothetical protein